MTTVLKRSLLFFAAMLIFGGCVPRDNGGNIVITEKTPKQDITTHTLSHEPITTENFSEQTTVDNSRTVYISVYGEKYHYIETCAGEEVIGVTENKASKIYSPCKKCAQ